MLATFKDVAGFCNDEPITSLSLRRSRAISHESFRTLVAQLHEIGEYPSVGAAVLYLQ